jgi:3D (Asp-Asp-Asp) domain-containing protein/peptidoglycan hydrolase CwlO-like protein
VVGAGAIAAAGEAEPRSGADPLRAERAALESREASALLGLYALESQLAAARAELDAARGRHAELQREQARTAEQLDLARRALAVAEALRAERLRVLYELGDLHPLAVLLGAETFDDAITGLDELRFAAEQDVQIVAQARHARRALVAARRSLSERRADAAVAARAAAERAAELEHAHAVRLAFVRRLAGEQRLKAAQIAALEREARAAQQTAQTLTQAPSAGAGAPEARTTAPVAAPAEPGPPGAEAGSEGEGGEGDGGGGDQPAQGAQTLTVEATAYSLPGRTATGIPVAYGVVAVDPAVIPLGTRMYIPGYGEGVAADTGSAIKGNKIDVWLPTRSQARTWGRRTVTITIY